MIARPWRPWPATVCAAILWCAWPAPAAAQVWLGSPAPRLGSLEASGGVVFFSGYEMGTTNAELTRNVNAGTGPYDLFRSTSRMKPAVGIQGRLGFYVSHSVAIEGGVQYARPNFSVRLAADAEEAPDLTATEPISRYVIDGSLVLHLSNLSFAGGKGVPFIAGGGGYLRELHDGNGVIETGTELHGGGGVKLWFGSGARRLGVRADVGFSMRDGGFDFRDGRRTLPTAGVSLSYLF